MFGGVLVLFRQWIAFITLRRRAPGLMQTIDQTPRSAWRRIELKGVSRQYKHPLILDHRTALGGYTGPVRQVVVADLGHEEPTILLTNQLTRPAPKLVERYAQRMIIENTIADGKGWVWKGKLNPDSLRAIPLSDYEVVG